MAQTLLGAIEARFTATIFDIAGGAWVEQAAEPFVLPLVTYGYNGNRDFQFDNAYTDTGTVTFTIFAKGLAGVESYIQEVNNVFNKNWDEIVITSAKVTSMIRTTYTVAAIQTRAPDGAQVYRGEISFEVRVSGIDT